LSEALDTALKKVDLYKYVEQIEDELEKVVKNAAQPKTPDEAEAGKRKLQELVRKQADNLAGETGVRGNPIFVFMLMSSILNAAWTGFAIKRGMIDMSRSFEERLRLEELLSSLGLVLSDVVTKSAEFADMYGKKEQQQQQPQ